MIDSVTLLAYIVQFLYIFLFIPPIITSYRFKTSRGLSDVLLLGYLNGYLGFTYFLSCFNVSLGMQALNALQFSALLVLIFQRFFYDSSSSFYFYFFLFLGNMMAALLFLPIAWRAPIMFGTVAGWFAAVVFGLTQVWRLIRFLRKIG